ncbi:MAG: 3-phosphoshikimate 1-carboxyvinyltransferase [Rikenellaceae bacterium]
MNITIYPALVSGEIYSPASKSYTQRAVAISSLVKGESTITNFGLCNDTSAAMGVAKNLGVELSLNDRTLTVKGGELKLEDKVLNIGESGLSTRLFTPFASLLSYPVTITGHGSILTRPIDMMLQPLTELGVKISSNKGKLPIELCGVMSGGEISIDGSLSSQFLTGLLISLPVCAKDSIINVNQLRSKPYIDMTLAIIETFGVTIINENYERFIIKGNQQYKPTVYNIEGDWSGASCLLVAGATMGNVTMNNLSYESQQADKEIITAIKDAGATVIINENSVTVEKNELKGFTFDATECPDLFPALVALAAACKGETVLKGTSRLTHKESDRAKTLKDIYETLGISVDISKEDLMVITGCDIKGGVTLNSHNDHRIAMSAAVATLRASAANIITDAECVNKSYNDFYKDLKIITNNQLITKDEI